MKFSVGALRSVASSTIFSIRLMALSLAFRTTRSHTTLSVAIIPAMTSCPASINRGIDSPVSAAVLKVAEDPRRRPSRGTRSPGCTSIFAPISTFSGRSLRPSGIRAKSGRKARRLLMLSRARSTALSCSPSPMQ